MKKFGVIVGELLYGLCLFVACFVTALYVAELILRLKG